MKFLDQQQQLQLQEQQFLLQQSALQINFPIHQQQQHQQYATTQSRQLDEQHNPAQGYFDKSGNLCLVETLDGVVKESIVRYKPKDKSHSSQKKRKKRRRVKKSEQIAAATSTKKKFGK